jgi:phosphocarrier protein
VIRRQLTVVNRLGLHMRAANVFADAASRFSSAIHVSRGGIKVNGKSIMGLMMLAAPCGSDIVLEVDGPDEESAFGDLSRLVGEGFGEDRGEEP